MEAATGQSRRFLPRTTSKRRRAAIRFCVRPEAGVHFRAKTCRSTISRNDTLRRRGTLSRLRTTRRRHIASAREPSPARSGRMISGAPRRPETAAGAQLRHSCERWRTTVRRTRRRLRRRCWTAQQCHSFETTDYSSSVFFFEKYSRIEDIGALTLVQMTRD